jgi:dynein heavy chain
MVKLWMHESMRVFHDRLINAEDKKWFTDLISEMGRSVFRMEIDNVT